MTTHCVSLLVHHFALWNSAIRLLLNQASYPPWRTIPGLTDLAHLDFLAIPTPRLQHIANNVMQNTTMLEVHQLVTGIDTT